jgi:hypothetical protein
LNIAPRLGRDIFRLRFAIVERFETSFAICQGSIMPNSDRVPMFQPCYRIHDLVEIRSENPHYARSLPRVLERKPVRRIALWFRALTRSSKRLRQDL